MSELENMILTLCPSGVAFKPLGEVGTFIRGNGLQKKDFSPEGVGCIHYGQIYTHYGLYTYDTKSKVPATLATRLAKVDTGDLVIACTSENIEDVCKAVVWLGHETIVTGGHSAVFKHSLEPKFVAYFFQSNAFQVQKRKYARGTKVIDIRIDDLAKIEIPVPPIEIQRIIVSYLDNFTELTDQLSAELMARRAQYEYYRDNLLSFSDLSYGGGIEKD